MDLEASNKFSLSWISFKKTPGYLVRRGLVMDTPFLRDRGPEVERLHTPVFRILQRSSVFMYPFT